MCFETVPARPLFSAEDQDSAHLFRPRMQQGIQIAIKTRALERCREMDLHPNSSRVLALTLLRIGSVSNSRKSFLLNCKPQYFNGYCKLSTNAQLRLLMPDVKILPISDFNELWNEHLFYLWSTSAIHPCTEADLDTHSHANTVCREYKCKLCVQLCKCYIV